MSGIDDAAFAALLCDWCLEVEPGQRILVAAPTLAEPLAVALHAALLEREAWPFLMLSPDAAARQFIELSADRQIDGVNPMQEAVYAAMDASLRITAPTNTRALSGADPDRQRRIAHASRGLSEALLSRRWALSIWPTEALAQEANMSLNEYTAFLKAALFLDQPDPIAAWQRLSDTQQRLVDRLTPAREIRILSEGTDLTLNVTGRAWQNSNGRRNMPSGEVFTSPLESSANGRIVFDVPSNNGGVHVSGVALEFVDGVVVNARAEHGDARLQAQLESDAGARRLGEIGIGTNRGIDRATGSTLLDEKIGGTVHLALGRSYTECGGVNESVIHWDLICDLRSGGEIVVDGEVLSRDGQFL